MKKMLLFALVTMAFLSTGCKHRIGQAPNEVLQTFGTMFPGAIEVEWSRQISTFTADFYHDQHEKHVQFDSTGNWLRTRTRMSIYEVPVPVIETARKYSNRIIEDVYLFEQSKVPVPIIETARKYSNRIIDDVYLFELSNGAAAYYMVEYKQETPFSTKQINILANGTILSAF